MGHSKLILRVAPADVSHNAASHHPLWLLTQPTSGKLSPSPSYPERLVVKARCFEAVSFRQVLSGARVQVRKVRGMSTLQLSGHPLPQRWAAQANTLPPCTTSTLWQGPGQSHQLALAPRSSTWEHSCQQAGSRHQAGSPRLPRVIRKPDKLMHDNKESVQKMGRHLNAISPSGT